jgi:hypothetical protein
MDPWALTRKKEATGILYERFVGAIAPVGKSMGLMNAAVSTTSHATRSPSARMLTTSFELRVHGDPIAQEIF